MQYSDFFFYSDFGKYREFSYLFPEEKPLLLIYQCCHEYKSIGDPQSTEMTIDEKSFHFFFQSNPTKATELVNQVKEVTGSTDEEIKRAFDQSKDANGEFCLQGAVDYLLAPHGVVSTTTSTTAAVPSYPSLPPPASSPQKTKVVDLTDDNKSEDDLQRAIALSLQDGGLVSQNTAATSTAVSGISQEEQNVSKALEASLRESSQVHRKKDSENPHDRQREGQWPVGLKNVGMTCWFSAVIQSLFHIPAFIQYNMCGLCGSAFLSSS